MGRKIVRYAVAVLSAALVFIGLKFALEIFRFETKIKLCQAAVSSACLAELGFEQAMSHPAHYSSIRVTGMLGQMDMIYEARALALLTEERKNYATDDAQHTSDKRVASHRIIAAVTTGNSLQEAILRTPGVYPGALWISALYLMGGNPYGHSERKAGKPDERTLKIVNDIADEIVVRAKETSESSQTLYLLAAAELQTRLGHRAEVLQILAAVPHTEEPTFSLSENLVRLVGIEAALEFYQAVGGQRPDILLTLASVEFDADKARAYLDEAFAAFSDNKPFPDYSMMVRTVERSADLGYTEHALGLSRQIALKANEKGGLFPAISLVFAAEALLAAGGSESEIKENLSNAENEFPQTPSTVIGVGIISGPIKWNDGIGQEVRRKIANLSARLGDLDTARRMMEGLGQARFSWNQVLTPEIPTQLLIELLDTASTVLTKEELAYVRAQLAVAIVRSGPSESQSIWAHKIAAAILVEAQLSGNLAAQVYTSILRVAARQQDHDMETKALTLLTQAALKTRQPNDLIRAGFEWYKAEEF